MEGSKSQLECHDEHTGTGTENQQTRQGHREGKIVDPPTLSVLREFHGRGSLPAGNHLWGDPESTPLIIFVDLDIPVAPRFHLIYLSLVYMHKMKVRFW
jgi:hypothetical protein